MATGREAGWRLPAVDNRLLEFDRQTVDGSRTLSGHSPLDPLDPVYTGYAPEPLIPSGLYLVQPTWVEPTLALLPDRHQEKSHEQSACQEAIGFDAALARASGLVPTGSRWTALYPHDEDPLGRLGRERSHPSGAAER